MVKRGSYKIKKEFKNKKLKGVKKGDNISLNEMYELNRKVMKRSLILSLIVLFIWISVGTYYVMYRSNESNILGILVIAFVSVFIVYIRGIMYKYSFIRKKGFKSYLGGTLDVEIGEKDIIEIDEENREIIFKYNEAGYKVKGLDIRIAKDETVLKFKDNLYEELDYGRLYNVTLYKKER